jgi:hypothetical protein
LSDAAGLDGVAVLSPDGEPLGYAGAIARHDVRALAALVSRDGPPDLLRRVFNGELAATTLGHETLCARDVDATSLEHRAVFLGIAARCVFVIALASADLVRSRVAASDLRDDIERLIRDSRVPLDATWVPSPPDSSGSGSPAEAFAWPPRPRAPGRRN